MFEYFILLAIGANCIVLALNTPLPNNDRTDMAQQLVSVAARKRQYLIILPSFENVGLPSIEQFVFYSAVFVVLL